MGRARALVAQAKRLKSAKQKTLKEDVLRAAWMMAIGASDAYFSDAYADLITRTLTAKEYETSIELPNNLKNLRIPVHAIIRDTQPGWRWRMAARNYMENETVLSFQDIKKLFNGFYHKNPKMLSNAMIKRWIVHEDPKRRLFGLSRVDVKTLKGKKLSKGLSNAQEQFGKRFKTLYQRRHDCIHNCDRRSNTIKSITELQTTKCIDDVVFLVEKIQEELSSQFPKYLIELGFSAITRNKVI